MFYPAQDHRAHRGRALFWPPARHRGRERVLEHIHHCGYEAAKVKRLDHRPGRDLEAPPGAIRHECCGTLGARRAILYITSRSTGERIRHARGRVIVLDLTKLTIVSSPTALVIT